MNTEKISKAQIINTSNVSQANNQDQTPIPSTYSSRNCIASEGIYLQENIILPLQRLSRQLQAIIVPGIERMNKQKVADGILIMEEELKKIQTNFDLLQDAESLKKCFFFHNINAEEKDCTISTDVNICNDFIALQQRKSEEQGLYVILLSQSLKVWVNMLDDSFIQNDRQFILRFENIVEDVLRISKERGSV